MNDEKKITEDMLTAAIEVAYAAAKRRIPSSTLSRALEKEVGDGVAALTLPHYWAVYYHDGFGPVNAAPGKVLCWFPYPFDDPRFTEGWPPVRASEVRHLTKEEFYDFLAENRRRALLGQGPIMLISRSTRARPKKPFFTDLDAEIEGPVADAIDAVFRANLLQFRIETSGNFSVEIRI